MLDDASSFSCKSTQRSVLKFLLALFWRHKLIARALGGLTGRFSRFVREVRSRREREREKEFSRIKLETSKSLRLGRINVSGTKVWIIIGISVAGIIIFSETRRRRRASRTGIREDFGAFIERFELLPSPQPPPPAARQLLYGLTFAISDNFDVKGYVSGFGNPDWKRTHEPATRTAVAVSCLLKNGAICVGKTVMDELAFGITGENMHYGTPTNPELPSQVPGGSSSGSAVVVAAGLVDFALGTDTTGCIRTPASFCGVLGFRPSHGVVSTVGVLPNSQSLDTVGWFACDPSTLHHVGHVLLQLPVVELRRSRRFIFADDCFELSNVPKQKSLYVVSKATENLSGCKYAFLSHTRMDLVTLVLDLGDGFDYDQTPQHVNISQHISSNVPSLKGFRQLSSNLSQGTFNLKVLTSVMVQLQRYEFKTNHEEWVKTVKPKLGPDISARVLAAIDTTPDNIKTFYKVRTEMRAALNSLLKDDGILVIPTISDSPQKLNSSKKLSTELYDRAFALVSIATMSGCCQVTVPLGKHDGSPISVSFIASHGADKFLLDTVLDMFSSLQEQVSVVSNSLPVPDSDGSIDTSELLKEKGNSSFKGRQWNKAVNYYSEAIKLNSDNATYYCNRAAAYLELGCFQQAEADCSQAILLDKKNVKAYLRRGTAREMLLCYKKAVEDFKHALVLEPQNKVAKLAEQRLKKLMV